jgi:hypothetical protein
VRTLGLDLLGVRQRVLLERMHARCCCKTKEWAERSYWVSSQSRGAAGACPGVAAMGSSIERLAKFALSLSGKQYKTACLASMPMLDWIHVYSANKIGHLDGRG